MRIHLFRQPIFYFAKRLIHPTLNRIGITPNRIDTYNTLWDFTSNVTRNGGFAASLYTTWHLRRMLQGKVSVDRFNSSIRNYINLDNNMIETFNRLVSSNYGDILPFIRQINYIIATIIGNISLLCIKNFLKTTFLGALTTIFTCLASTIGILWIPSLANITSFLNFALQIKTYIDNLLPWNLKLPIPQWLKDKLTFSFMNSTAWLFNTPLIQYVLSKIGFTFFDWLSFGWFVDLLNYILPFDLRYFSLFFKPIKSIIFYFGWFFVNKLLVYDMEGNFAGINWKKWFNNFNPNKNSFNDRERFGNNHIYIFMTRFSEYLFHEFNLFYQ